jgi:hypothetical protein
MSWLWPFRTGSDEKLHASPPESVFDTIGDMPKTDYLNEVRKYNKTRWRKGFLQSVGPSTLFSAVVGFVWGYWQSFDHSLRHASRPRIIMRHMGAMTSIALLTTSAHHFLVVASNFQTSLYQPMFAGALGGIAYSVAMNNRLNMTSGALIGFIYTGIYQAIEYYHERAMWNFLATQQQMETPIYRVSPELQPMYRAFLFDHRPIEETDELRRKALLEVREENDTRADYMSYAHAVKGAFDYFEMPEWFPLRPVQLDEKAALLHQRQKDDMLKRRTTAAMGDNEGRAILSHPLRSKQAKRDIPE